MEVRLKRAYEAPSKSDGVRILVDRLWPRGLRKEKARIDLWMKEIAPSTALRKWFGHDPKKWREFTARYRRELATRGEELKLISQQARHGCVTLVYSARDEEHNQAVVLRQVLEGKWHGAAV
ncbi:MAG: DUF488 domain-containing protein [Verrucomicrobia bacterium]|nr:DUF488 domain-containing protein [Verrucomicrobiota bacterium]